MKTFFLVLSILLITVQAHGAWYIFNSDNQAVAITQYKPSEEDLLLRNETAIQTNESIPLERAEFVNGKVKGKMKSQSEKDKEKSAEEENEEMKLIYHRMFTDTYKALKAEGVKFKHMEKHIDAEDL